MTLTDIRTAAAQKLTGAFPGLYHYEDELPQSYTRPCFLTQILSSSKKNDNVCQFSKTVAVKLQYYPQEGAGIGLLEMQDRFEELFDLVLQVDGRPLDLDSTKGEIIDKVLNFTFELSYTDSREDTNDQYELMESIECKEEF